MVSDKFNRLGSVSRTSYVATSATTLSIALLGHADAGARDSHDLSHTVTAKISAKKILQSHSISSKAIRYIMNETYTSATSQLYIISDNHFLTPPQPHF